MAEPRGTVLSRLPSGGITHLHRYYPAIRLPVCLLPSSVSCPAYRKTHTSFCGAHRLSPVDAVSLSDMADLRPRGAAIESHQSDNLACCLLPRAKHRHTHLLFFGAEMPYDPVVSLSTLSPRCYHRMPKTRFRWLVRPYRTGFPPAQHCTLFWAHAHL